jgi:hypothetical protein
MTVVKRGNCEWFKGIITIDEGKERLRFHSKYGWNFFNYLYTPRRNQKLDKQGTFVEKLETLPKKVLKEYLFVIILVSIFIFI